MSDAAFDPAVLQAIWPTARWRCPLSGAFFGAEPIDPHHILGRNRGDPLYSSPFNCSPLLRRIHDYAPVTSRYLAMFLLETTRKAVEDAVRAGRYELTDTDAAFTEIAREWELQHFPRMA